MTSPYKLRYQSSLEKYYVRILHVMMSVSYM